jgi:hypothetical protein
MDDIGVVSRVVINCGKECRSLLCIIYNDVPAGYVLTSSGAYNLHTWNHVTSEIVVDVK